jgi:hypothetical protein
MSRVSTPSGALSATPFKRPNSAVRPASIGIVPPAWQKMKWMSRSRANEPE